MGESERVRIDRWLWAARFFKTRSLASEAVGGGHVHVNGSRAKPAKGVAVGDTVTVTQPEMTREVVVTGLSDRRGPAAAAALLYEETPESTARREQEREARRLSRPMGPPPASGRPSKRDRRQINTMKGRTPRRSG